VACELKMKYDANVTLLNQGFEFFFFFYFKVPTYRNVHRLHKSAWGWLMASNRDKGP
jgi:hypothetical protein